MKNFFSGLARSLGYWMLLRSAKLLGVKCISIYAPGHEDDEDVEVKAIHLAWDEDDLLQSCRDLLDGSGEEED